LDKFLTGNALEVQIKLIEEAEMLSTTKRLRAAFNLPEQLPRETGGGAP
jgi:hypothetical protein